MIVITKIIIVVVVIVWRPQCNGVINAFIKQTSNVKSTQRSDSVGRAFLSL